MPLNNVKRLLNLSGYENAPESKKPLEAPAPAFALSEERAMAPEYQEARTLQDEGIRGLANKRAEELAMTAQQDAGIPNQIGGIDIQDIIGASQMAGSIGKVAPVVQAESAMLGAAGAGVAPTKFGRIIQVMKPAEKFVQEKVIPVGKIIRSRK